MKLRYLPSTAWWSLKAIAKFLYFKPAYALLAFVFSVILYELIFWSLNLGLGWFLFTSNQLPFASKLDIIVGSYTNVFDLPLAPLSATIVLVSLLQGVILSAIVFMVKANRENRKASRKLFGSVGLAGGLSVLGLGCVPCGTSLVTPLLTLFFAASAPAIAAEVGFYAVIVALVVSLFALYVTGKQLAVYDYRAH